MPRPQPFYLPLRDGRRFCVRYSPEAPGAGSVLLLPALAEEMNKSRRMVSLQSRALAARGWQVLLLDPYGCGDSDGDFAEADWLRWRDDVLEVAQWWRTESGSVPVLWGVRAGCLLACEAARQMDAHDFLFWQPPVSGAQVLQQFLRLRIASAAVGPSSGKRVSTQDLRDSLARGESLEVGGYTLSPGLALGLDAAVLELPPATARVIWMEVMASVDGSGSPAARSRVEAWRASGASVTLGSIQGPAFWQTQEIAECDGLIQATLDALDGWRR